MADSVPASVKAFQDDVRRNLRSTLEANLARLDLVTREEFEVQRAVLERSREKLDAMEKQIRELEDQIDKIEQADI